LFVESLLRLLHMSSNGRSNQTMAFIGAAIT
jgi:hypothetical protein